MGNLNSESELQFQGAEPKFPFDTKLGLKLDKILFDSYFQVGLSSQTMNFYSLFISMAINETVFRSHNSTFFYTFKNNHFSLSTPWTLY